MADNKQNSDKQSFNPQEVESKWQKIWEEKKIYSPNLDRAKRPAKDEARHGRPFYNLMMFPYPSAEGMHVGNMYAFTGADVYGRFMRMRGHDVFEPMGLDGFGIHSENYAIKVGRHPKELAKISEANFYRQLRATGNGFDWTRKLETYDPKYYKWTQWLFIQLFKAGLAYRAKAKVNWCPSCKTVLADEQVLTKLKVSKNVILNSSFDRLRMVSLPNPFQDPKQSRREMLKPFGLAQGGQVQHDKKGEEVKICERCETGVEKKDLEQWFFRITNYADRLLENIAKLDWSEKVKIAQRQWIGRSEGAIIQFSVLSSQFSESGHSVLSQSVTEKQKTGKLESENRNQKTDNWKIEVFTTRPDTLYGATFLVVSPEHPMVTKILSLAGSHLAKLRTYVQEAKKKTEQERMAEGKEKTGVFTGLYAVNPLNQEKLPVWIADYAVMGYGTGALFGDAHDERDVEFAKKYKIPLRVTVITGDKEKDERIKNFEECFTGYGTLIDSGEFSGLTSEEAKKRITGWLKDHNSGGPEITYHLRDWLISRQRYWGPPIPMIYCEVCANKGNCYNIVIPTKRERVEGSNTTDSVEKDSSTPQLSWVARNDKVGMAGWFPVSEQDLPVLLPDVKDWKPTGIRSTSSGQAVKSPLANHPEFYKVKCPNCGGPAKRETDVSDTFLDSSWYFLRYLATEFDDIPFPIASNVILNSKGVILNSVQDPETSSGQRLVLDETRSRNKFGMTKEQVQHDIGKRRRWLPVTMYIGGAEHSVLHLLYSRFIWKVLCDLGYIDFSGEARPRSAWEEPFSRFYAHGLLIKEGAKMSKSRGNVVVPDEYIRKFGADTLRMYLMFLGPFSQGGDFYDTALEGMYRFVKRLWRLFTQVQSSKFKVQSSEEGTRMMHKTIKKVTEDISSLRYNTAIAGLMEWHNFLKLEVRSKPPMVSLASGGKLEVSREEAETFLKLLAPFAPHVAEELWQRFQLSVFGSQLSESGSSASRSTSQRTTGKQKTENRQQRTDNWSIHLQPWPTFDPKFLTEDEVTIVVQVNGKVRDTFKNQKSKIKNQKYVEEIARESKRIRKYIEGKSIKKVVYVEGKIINFVTDGR